MEERTKMIRQMQNRNINENSINVCFYYKFLRYIGINQILQTNYFIKHNKL